MNILSFVGGMDGGRTDERTDKKWEKAIMFWIKYISLWPDYGVTLSFSRRVSKRESGGKPELYP